MRARLTIIPICLLLFSCGTGTHSDSQKEKDDLGIVPRFRFDRDTITLGDSVTGVIGGIFRSSLSPDERQQLIGTLGYRIDTVDTELKFDTLFYTKPRVNDSTYRFAFLPNYQNSDGTSKRSIYASIRVEYYLKDNQKQEHIFRNRFDYYIRK